MLASPASECSDFSAGARNTAEASQEFTAERGSADFLRIRVSTMVPNGQQKTRILFNSIDNGQGSFSPP